MSLRFGYVVFALLAFAYDMSGQSDASKQLLYPGGISVRFGTGSFQNVEAVVTRFMSEPLERPRLYLLGEFIDIPPFEPAGPFVYTNPVVVLINGSTFSAGELTTEILKQLSQVTVVGDTTGGGGVVSSGGRPEHVGEYRLPSGKNIYIGTGYFERYDGEMFEWNGVLPDVRIPQTREDAEKGIDRQLEFAIKTIKL